jgi:hypothetical protein
LGPGASRPDAVWIVSPNGTTAAALSILLAPNTGLPQLMDAAMTRATARSRELNAPTLTADNNSGGDKSKKDDFALE